MKISVYCGIILSVLAAVPAFAYDWQAEVDDLREDLRALQRQVYRGETAKVGKVSETVSSDVQVKITEYEENLRKLNGRVDELEYKVKQFDERLTKINRDMEIRFKILEGRQIPQELSAPAPTVPTVYEAAVAKYPAKAAMGASIQGDDLAPIAGTEVAGQSTTSDLPPISDGPQSLIPEEPAPVVEPAKPASAKEMYDSGLQAFNNGLFDEAELAFEHILKEFPKDKLAGNAQYWLGEVYYRRNEFQKAKLAFKKGYEGYPEGYKAADSLFKLGMTLKSLKETKNACIVFTSFSSEFPKATADLKQRATKEAAQLGCK